MNIYPNNSQLSRIFKFCNNNGGCYEKPEKPEKPKINMFNRKLNLNEPFTNNYKIDSYNITYPTSTTALIELNLEHFLNLIITDVDIQSKNSKISIEKTTYTYFTLKNLLYINITNDDIHNKFKYLNITITGKKNIKAKNIITNIYNGRININI